MGLSIHYSGSIANPDCLSELICEVEDIAAVYEWPCEVFNSEFPNNHFGKTTYNNELYGVCFTPPGCESVFISFLSNGKISGPAQLEFFGNASKEEEKKYLYIVSVKTQFAGIDVHIVLVHLLRYLSQKYFARFNVSDEGSYWETSDENILRENFKKYSDLFNSFSSAIHKHPFQANESVDKYFARLIQLIKEKKQRGNNSPNKSSE
jgi:hypothetical protein